MANFLIHQKGFDVRSLISRQLDNLAYFVVFLHGTVATEILLESFADSLNIQIIRESCHRSNTLSPISLLHTNVNFFFRIAAALVAGILKCVWKNDKARTTKLSGLCRQKFIQAVRAMACLLLTICIEIHVELL
jgi:hypothetical protein